MARLFSKITFVARASVWTVRLLLVMAGGREAGGGGERWPFLMVVWYQPTPSWRGPLKSSLALAPCSWAAWMNASQALDLYVGSLTVSGPPAPWYGLAPRELFSARRK